MRLKRLVYVGSLVLLLFCIQEATPTLMLTSLIMALKGGLMVGKMSLGGLMMMLNAASNENQKSVARQNSIFSTKSPTPFDILSLMSTSQSNKVQVATQPSAPPTKMTTTPTAMTIMTTTPTRFAKRRIIRKKIKVKREVSEKTSIEKIISNNVTTSKGNESLLPEAEAQKRLYRQITNLDPLMCLPKVLCGINSAPPSTKTSIMNDYAYLMKTILTRDDDEDEKKPVVNDDKVVTKTKNKEKNTDKNENDNAANDDDTGEEDFALNDEDFERLALKEEEDIEALANDEMVDEEPGFLPFIMKDVHVNSQKHTLPSADYPVDDLPQEGEYGEDDYPRRPSPYEMSGRPLPHRRPPGPPHLVHKHSPDANKPQSSSSLLSYLPQIGFGKNKEGGNDAFSNDPFFAGFKRSMRSNETATITKEQEEVLKSIAVKRGKRDAYIQRKKKQLEMSSDPSEKFKIAAEVGQKLRSPRQCRALFNSCPFQYTEVLSMINNLRKAIQGQPEIPAQDQVQNLITKEAIQQAVKSATQQSQQQQLQLTSPSKNVINVATGNAGLGGITSISHQLPNGETVEINLKLLSQPTTTTSSTTTTEKSTTARTDAPKPSRVTKLPLSRPNDKEKVFDDDDERIYEHTAANAFDAASVASMRDRINSIESLESLKATILAIEKINNATLNRKKYGKPITYDGVFHEVTGLIPPKKRHRPNEEPVNDSTGSSSESAEDDEEDEDLPLTKQNEVQITIQKPVTQQPIRLRPQIQHVPQQRIRPNRPIQAISTTTSPIPTNKPKRVIKYKLRKPTVSPTEISAAIKSNSTYKITKVTKKQNPTNIVPFTEKENVMNPAVHKQPPPTPTASKKPSGKDKGKEEEYDEEDVDGDENDNDTSEEEEEDEENDGDGDREERLNNKKTQNDTHEDDEEAEESTERRVVIKPSIHGHPPPQQMQGPPPHGHPPQPHKERHPHGPPHPDRHSHGRPPPQLNRPHPERHPHGGPPSQRHPHGPPQQLQGRRPQRHAQSPTKQFFRRTFHTYSGRGRSIDNEEPTSTEKPKHPNHRYPCGVDSTTTEKNIQEEIQTTEESTTSTQAPPTLPFRYPKYASPHKPITDNNDNYE